MNNSNLCKKLLGGFVSFNAIIFTALVFFASTVNASVSTANPHYSNWSKHRAVIVKASVRAKIDPSNMAAMAYIESKFDGSTKRGLYQFESRTWRAMLKEYGPKYGLNSRTSMKDPMANALMAAELWKKNKGILTASLRRDVTPTEVYIAHFLGAGGAIKMLKARDNRLARDVVPQQARYNKTHFYTKGRAMTVGQFKAHMASIVNTPKRTFGTEARARALMTYDYAYNYTPH